MKITDVIFCDDVRQEILNKFTLVGCYNDRIRLTPTNEMKWPFPVKLGVYFRLHREKADFEPKKFQIIFFDSVEQILSLDGVIEMNEKDRPLVFVFTSVFQFKRSGQIHMKMKVQGDSNQEIELDSNLNFALEVIKA